MNAAEIEHALALLGEQLQELGLQKPIRLLMIEGAFMLTQTGSRRTTEDIDVRVQSISDPQYSDDYRIFKNAVRFVAYDTGFPQAWLSDTMSDFLPLAGPVPQGKRWRTFGPLLSVYVPPKSYILAHKLLAGRGKDLPDIRTLLSELRIHTRQQAQKMVKKYITNEDLRQAQTLQKMLTIFFPPS